MASGARRARVARARRALIALLAVASGLVLAYSLRPGGAMRVYVEEEVVLARLERHAPHFAAAASEFDLDPHLLAAMAWAESSGRQRVESSAGALGLMQVQLPTARDMARRLRLAEPARDDLLEDAALNVRLAAAYLAWLLPRQEHDVERALMAYNTGPTRFSGWLRDAGGYEAWRAEVDARGPPAPGSVRRYTERVLQLRDQLAASGVLGFEVGAPAPDRATSSERSEALAR